VSKSNVLHLVLKFFVKEKQKPRIEYQLRGFCLS